MNMEEHLSHIRQEMKTKVAERTGKRVEELTPETTALIDVLTDALNDPELYPMPFKDMVELGDL
jgi:hypothetical protein